MPSTAVYFDARPSRIAFIAASLMLSGVSKSGSPAPSPMPLRPAALSARAFSVTAIVGDGLMRLRWSASNSIEGLHCAAAGGALFVMRVHESSKGRFVEEIRLIQSLAAINPPRRRKPRFDGHSYA